MAEAAEGGGRKCILLVSSITSDMAQEQDQRRARDLLAAKGIAVQEVDGAQDENRDFRNLLFTTSGQRGKYPQVFFEDGGEYSFVGMWEQLETLNDMDELPAETLQSNPEIETFAKVFEGVQRA